MAFKGKLLSQDIPFLPQIALISSNLIPLLGVLFLDWQVYTLLALYWAESGVVGFYTVLKILKSDKVGKINTDRETKSEEAKNKIKKFKEKIGNYQIFINIAIAAFFVIHFGGFMMGHAVFLGVFFSQYATVEQLSFGGIAISLLGLMISHGISYYRNYIQQEEYKKYGPKELMAMPYNRIMVMHLVIVFSGFVTVWLGSHRMASLLLLIGVKVFFDLRAHIKEHI